MTAKLVAVGVYEQEIDNDSVTFWLSSDGIHSQRTSKDKAIGKHVEQVLSYPEVLAKSENQLTLPI